MDNSKEKNLPRWAFTLLAVGTAWASGIYLGKISIAGTSSSLLIPLIAFGLVALIMGWGALTRR